MIEPTTIEVAASQRMIITWEDGRVDEISARALRDACPCASCNSQAGGPKSVLSLVPEATIVGVGVVGAYALNIEFSDGHGTGIYPYDRLRELGAAVSR